MTGLSCLSITAGHVSLDVLERLSYSREELCQVPGGLARGQPGPRRRGAVDLSAHRSLCDLADLADCLATSDIAILATTAAHPLVDARTLWPARAAGAGPLTLVDLSMPRNVDPAVRALPWVRLIDLADLRPDEMSDAGDLVHDVATTEEIIETETRRYLRWLAGRSAATALHRMRSGAEDIAREELARIAGELPAEIRLPMERVLLRTVHRLVHKPTLELRAAAEADNGDLVSVLAGLFDASQPSAALERRHAGSARGIPGTRTAALARARPAFLNRRAAIAP